MNTVAGWLGTRTDSDNPGIGELGSRMLIYVAAGAVGTGLLALIVLYDDSRILTWAPPITLTLVGCVTWRFARVNSVAVSAFVIASLWAVLTGMILLYPGIPLSPNYALIILAAAFLLSPAASSFVAFASLGAIGEIARLSPGLEGEAVYSVAVFLMVTTGALVWMLVEPLRRALDWAWVAYEQTAEQTKEARARQGELARVTKSLNDTLFILEDLNRQLSQARTVAEEARHQKADFAAAVSHEMRTPVNLIIGFAEMLVLPHHSRAADLMPKTCQKQLQTIYRNACHLSNLIDDILDLSQIDANRLALHCEPDAVGDIVGEAVGVIRELIEDAGLALVVEVPPDLPRVNVDPTRVRQVLINLLNNACRFTEEGTITIRAHRDDHSVLLSVADTGVGIPHEDLPRVFEEFRQFGERHFGGSGLGLSICKRLIDLHGGNMWVESVQDQGSTFSFSLPLSPVIRGLSTSPSLERQIATMARHSTTPTLVVVDHGRTSKVFSRYLDGYRVTSVNGVEPAQRMLASGRADALLFGDARDVESWQQLQQATPSLHPIAFCPLRAAAHVPRELGVADYLVKPVTPVQLRTALRRLGKAWRSVGIVEDHAEMADLLVQMVRAIRPRCRVWHAPDGRQAMGLLHSDFPDVLLLDLLMPHLNGFELLHEIRRDERLRNIPVIVISGAEDRDEKVVAEMVGITRPGGMAVGEAMACLKRGLDSLLIRGAASIERGDE